MLPSNENGDYENMKALKLNCFVYYKQSDWSENAITCMVYSYLPSCDISVLGSKWEKWFWSNCFIFCPSSISTYFNFFFTLKDNRIKHILNRFFLVIPENKAKKPCVRLLITSISCKVTVCTTSFLFCNSPSRHCTNLVYKKWQLEHC